MDRKFIQQRLVQLNFRVSNMPKEIAAITGGTSGLGKGFVERFTKDGYEVSFSCFLGYFAVRYSKIESGDILWAKPGVRRKNRY